MFTALGILGWLILLPFLLIFYIPLRMARVRGRSVFIWFVLTLFLTPLITIPLIAILGDGYAYRRARPYYNR